MFVRHNPTDMLRPDVIAPLSWGVEIPDNPRLLFISGQIGVDAKGVLATGLIEQARSTWENIGHVLRSAGMNAGNIVRTGIYLSRDVVFTEEERAAFNKIRSEFLGENRPASTLLFVHRLMDPRWLVEIDAIAAQPAEL